MPIDKLRHSNEHFFRIAAAQGAGSTVGLVIDDGNAPTGLCAPSRRTRSAGAGADDDQIVALHRLCRSYIPFGTQEGFRVGSICIEGHTTVPYNGTHSHWNLNLIRRYRVKPGRSVTEKLPTG